MRPFQGLEALYAAFLAIHGEYAGSIFGRVMAVAILVLLLFAPLFGGLLEHDRAAHAAGLGAALVISVSWLDRRRVQLASQYWDASWRPNVWQRSSLAAYLLVVSFGAILASRFFGIWIGLAFLIIVGSLPLRRWVDAAREMQAPQ